MNVALDVVVVGEGPDVVLLPSLGRGAADYADLSARLADAGFRATAVNPRGAAGSPGPLDDMSMHDLAGDIAVLIEARCIPPVHLVGHAFGNRVARCVAADRPDLVRSVTLIAAGGRVPPSAEVLGAMSEIFGGGRLDLVGETFFAPGNDGSVWRDGWWPDALRAQSGAHVTPVSDWWTAGAAPMLVIQGLQDKVAPVENGRALAEELGDRVRLVELDGAGHALLPEQPETVARELISFLQAKSAP